MIDYNIYGRTIRVATWNIGGGYIKSNGDRYDLENLPYFIDAIRAADCDIVCLQEAHTFSATDSCGQIADISEKLLVPNRFCVPISESHLRDGAFLVAGLISRYPISSSRYIKLRNPGLEIVRPDGKHWRSFDKGLIHSVVRIEDKELQVITGHAYPFHHFKRNALDPDFSDIRKTMDSVVADSVQSGISILAGDLNFGRPEQLMPKAFSMGLRAAFAGVPTIPEKNQWDHILYSSGLVLRKYLVTEGLADHFLCVGEFSF